MIQKKKFQDFLTIGKIPYYISYSLLLLGLASGVVIDSVQGPPVILVMDGIAFVSFVATHILTVRKILNRGRAILFNLLIAMVVFFISGVILVENPEYKNHFEANVLVTILQAGLFASILGIAINKFASVIVSLITIFYLLVMVIDSKNEFLQGIFFLVALLLAGNILVVYFYRTALEGLLSNLNANIVDLNDKNYILDNLRTKAETLNSINQPYVIFGKNISGFVHDLKSDIGNLSMQLQLLDIKLTNHHDIRHQDLEMPNKAVSRLINRIDMVKFIANANPQEDPLEISIQTLIESAVYPFQIAPRFENRIRYEFDYDSQDVIHSKRHNLLRILENLIQNACEALIDRAHMLDKTEGYVGTITVGVKKNDLEYIISISDDGPGIPGCKDCELDNCLSCLEFELGKTSKPYGSGYGMVNVMSLCKEIGASIEIMSGAPSGTCVNIRIQKKF